MNFDRQEVQRIDHGFRPTETDPEQLIAKLAADWLELDQQCQYYSGELDGLGWES